MIKSLIDAGPVIALFDKSDNCHHNIINFFKKSNYKLYSTWPVITEVTYMLTFNINVQLDFLNWISKKAIEIIDIDIKEIDKLIEMMKKYSDVPMDLADASLLYLAQEYKINKIITIDSDYYFYRTKNKKLLENIFQK
ncbi:MAG: PIN domain-containing protein [Spirochaetes bacterium]|nr:PIN domain-containing protein [Spirochaetota bacterium]